MSTIEAQSILADAPRIVAAAIANGWAKRHEPKSKNRNEKCVAWKRRKRMENIANGLTAAGTPRIRQWTRSGLSRQEYMRRYRATH